MSSSPPEFRHPTRADAPRIAELLAAFDEQLVGESDWNVDELEREWRELELDRDVWMALDGEELVGYVALNERNDHWEFDGYVSPHRFGNGFGRAIVEHAEAEARRRGSPVTLTAVLGADEPAHRLLASLGFHEVRRFYRMTIELQAPPAEPIWPDGLRLVPLDFAADHEAVHAALDAAFAGSWNARVYPHDAWLERQRGRGLEDPWGWIVVRAGDEIAAVTALQRERLGVGWIGTVGVLPAWRRRGLGEAMIREAFRRFWEAGERRVGLGVDAQNETGATRLYERAGMHVSWSATFFEKELA